MAEMVIFTRTFDLLSWLIPRLDSFPRQQRFGVTKRLQDAALNFYETITAANTQRGAERQGLLLQADNYLDQLRFYLRLVTRWAWLNEGQYQHAAQMVAEIGRLLGGWRKQP